MRKTGKTALSVLLALSAAVLLAVTAWASTTYVDSIAGAELPNATATEGQFAGTATGSLPGGWYVDVKHQVLSGSATPVYITGGTFTLTTAINYQPVTVSGSFVRKGGTVTQTSGFSGCTDQTYLVDGDLSKVGINGGKGSGHFRATLTHYRALIWGLGCVTYSATVTGSVSLTF